MPDSNEHSRQHPAENHSSAKSVVVGDYDEPLAQQVYTGLLRTASRLEAELNRIFRPYDLTSATYAILRVLKSAGNEGRSCGDIAQQLIAEVPDMTRLLDRLERLDYVVRERSTVDRRKVKVRITSKGIEVFVALKDSVTECHRVQVGHISQARLTELIALLSEIRREEPLTTSVAQRGDSHGDTAKYAGH